MAEYRDGAHRGRGALDPHPPEHPHAGMAEGGPGPGSAPPGVRVHPLGLCESDSVGAGTRVWAWAHVLPGAVVGTDCNICDHAFVEGGVRLGDRVTVKNAVLLFDLVEVGDDVFLGPNVVFTNDLRPRAHIKRGPAALLPTHVRTGVTIGANSTIVCGTTLGAHAFVAAGSVVTRDVPAYAFMAGNPARRKGWVCVCGERLPASLVCRDCGRKFTETEPGLAEIG
jgi:UDP-2-acetamido-3-amino-2,3-dideoxy-glucuronate N-acetyltransferase